MSDDLYSVRAVLVVGAYSCTLACFPLLTIPFSCLAPSFGISPGPGRQGDIAMAAV